MTMRGDKEPSPHVPQLRALLFTDLVDSTSLVERIGDTAAAELFQQHDRLVLAMQQRWHGQQIDRSDGLFLLFERPVDALGFALDYQQGLRQLGQANNVPLFARAGLHVGEVILWDNSAEAIALGSKPVEVEGLAKPMAARLMQLARPGQVLLSATAESMVRRATDRLGDVGKGLKWKSYGRWRFKGVAQPMDVHGVATPELPPVGRPRATPKAMRDIPFWRRPMAMAAEATFAIVLVVGGWFLLRPQPAIAFVERDWVVLGDVNNRTTTALLGDGLQQALYMSLGQSRFVNVLSELKVRETLQLMQKPVRQPLDRDLAVQVAIREGARAVLLPSVFEVNNKVRISVEVLDPRTGKTVYTRFADGHGLESVLASTDKVVASLRDDLGEAMRDVSTDHKPLPTVATADLDALHAYAKGVEALAEARYSDAVMFFEQATRLDPEFAFAYVGQMRIKYAMGNLAEAAALYETVRTRRARLTARDQLYLDAWALEFTGEQAAKTAEKWRLLTELYPDDSAGWMNYSKALFAYGSYDLALDAATPLLGRQQPYRAQVLVWIARVHLANGNTAAARSLLNEAARQPGWRGDGLEAALLALEGNFDSAISRFSAMTSPSLGTRLEHAAVLGLQGKPGSAAAMAEEAVTQCRTVAEMCSVSRAQAAAWEDQQGHPTAAVQYRKLLDAAVAEADVPRTASSRHLTLVALGIAYQAVRAGHGPSIRKQLARLEVLAGQDDDPRVHELSAMLGARMALDEGDLERATAQMSLVPAGTLYQWRVLAHDVAAARGNEAESANQAKWLQGHRGLAFAEDAGGYVLLALNIGDMRRLAAKAIQPAT